MSFDFSQFAVELNTTSNTHPLWKLFVQLKKLQDRLIAAIANETKRIQEEQKRELRSKARNIDSKTKNSLANWKEYIKDGAANLGSAAASSVDYNILALNAKIEAFKTIINALNVKELDLDKFNKVFADNYSSDLSLNTRLGGTRLSELTPTEELLNALRVYVNQQETNPSEPKDDLFVTIMHRLAERERALTKGASQESVNGNAAEEVSRLTEQTNISDAAQVSSTSQAIVSRGKNLKVDFRTKRSLLDDLMQRLKKVASASADKNLPINPMIFYVEIVRWEGEKPTGWASTNQELLAERRVAPFAFLPPPKSASMLESLKKELLDQALRNKDPNFGLTEVKAIRVEALQGHDQELDALKIYCKSLIENSNQITEENLIVLTKVVVSRHLV